MTRESNPSHQLSHRHALRGTSTTHYSCCGRPVGTSGHSPKRSKEWVCLVDLHLSQPPLGVTWLAKVAAYLAGLARAPQMDSFRTKEAFKKGPLLLRRQSSAVNASAHVSFR